METPATTPLVCESAEMMKQEATFMSSLANVAGYQIAGDKLIAATAQNQRLLTFAPAKPTPFEATNWALKLVFDGKQWASLIPETTITAQFEGDQMSGSSGCNSYNAAIEKEGGKLTISEVASTEIACSEPDGLMDQESAYLAMLQSVAGYQQVGGVLALLNVDGQAILLFGEQ